MSDLWLRDDARCARCGADLADTGWGYSLHHRKPRGMGGTKDPRSNDPRNLIHLCGSGTTGCHGHVESHRTQAYETGWLLRDLDHLDMPLLCPDGRLVTLHEDGARTDEITAETGDRARDLFQTVTT